MDPKKPAFYTLIENTFYALIETENTLYLFTENSHAPYARIETSREWATDTEIGIETQV